ncbi:MAG: hypothetical protein AABZ00_15340 [Chloroflexota bacterium]
MPFVNVPDPVEGVVTLLNVHSVITPPGHAASGLASTFPMRGAKIPAHKPTSRDKTRKTRENLFHFCMGHEKAWILPRNRTSLGRGAKRKHPLRRLYATHASLVYKLR